MNIVHWTRCLKSDHFKKWNWPKVVTLLSGKPKIWTFLPDQYLKIRYVTQICFQHYLLPFKLLKQRLMVLQICLYLHLWGNGFSFVLRTIIDRCELNSIFMLESSWWLRCHHYYLSINIIVSVIWRRNWYIWGWYRKIHTPLEDFLVCIFMLEEKVSK